MELWVPITIAAAFLQNLRSMLQKHLKGQLSTAGATYVRFLFAAPLAVLYVFVLHFGFDMDWPAPGVPFLLYATVGGVGQIMATALLVAIFSYRNFDVGTAYSKTDTIQTALFGAIILLEPVGWSALIAILVSMGGVMALSVSGGASGWRGLLTGLTRKAAVLGILSGSCFAIAAICYRAASLSLAGPGFLMQAGFTLSFVTTMQAVAMGVFVVWREPGQFAKVLGAWRVAGWVGLAGMLASAGWFTAMTIQNAAYVRALGQIELVFTFIAARVVFRERARASETAGIVLVVAGILILLLA